LPPFFSLKSESLGVEEDEMRKKMKKKNEKRNFDYGEKKKSSGRVGNL
jgi:hypothetical protein